MKVITVLVGLLPSIIHISRDMLKNNHRSLVTTKIIRQGLEWKDVWNGKSCEMVLAFTKKDHGKIRSIWLNIENSPIISRTLPTSPSHVCQLRETQDSSDNVFFGAE
jgi:hypothetical protein